jgi:CDP-6-deoxy-D-xylo-4-hexulose-3-dehydrase
MAIDLRYGGSMCGEEEREAGRKALDKAIDSGQWQTADETAAFERELSEYMEVKHSIMTTSGSAAGLLALSALELPKGSEVIIPAVTVPTIFNIILQCGLKPVVVDCEIGTYNLDLKSVKKAIGKKTKAIIAVHILGNPVDMIALRAIAKPKGIKIIEDNCDGFSTTLNGWKAGSLSDISFTSTHAAHIITTGVGGVVFTNDDKLAQNVRQYRDWGRQANTTEPHKVKTLPKDYNPRFVYDKIGYNLQILELQSAIGRVQLRKVSDIKQKRKDNFEYIVVCDSAFH